MRTKIDTLTRRAREQKTISAAFFKTDTGAEPVREWLKTLSNSDKKIVGMDIKTIEFGWPIGMPACRPIGDGIWEVRSHLTDGRISRILFCIVDGFMVLLHGFIKKSPKTPKADLSLAKTRKRRISEMAQ